MTAEPAFSSRTEEWSERAARRCITLFTRSLIAHPLIAQVLVSGSYGRCSAGLFVKDIGLVVVLPQGPTPEQAQRLVQQVICLGVLGRSVDDADRYRGTRLDGRSVRFRADLGDPDGPFFGLPQVDVVPAYRDGGRLMLPDLESGAWAPAGAEGPHAALTNIVLAWAQEHVPDVTPAAVERLVQEFLPVSLRGEPMSTCVALAGFFRNAAENSGRAWSRAADLAEEALVEELFGNKWGAERLWQRLLGKGFGPGWLVSLNRPVQDGPQTALGAELARALVTASIRVGPTRPRSLA